MAGTLSGTSVLLADDDADSLELIECIFKEAGATVRAADTARGALSLLPGWTPDVLLLDIAMPGMDGYALLEAIRKDPSLDAVPAIAVTGSALERDRARAMAAGFAVHVAKPFDVEALLHLVGTLTGARSAADPPEVAAFRRKLRADGLHAALGFLNRRCSHRFTGVYRFDGERLRSLHLFDRMDPAKPKGPDLPLIETYCSIVGIERKEFVSVHTMLDPRLVEHPARLTVRSYCGELLRNADATPFGTLCSFDLDPQPATEEFLQLLRMVAPIVSAEVGAPA